MMKKRLFYFLAIAMLTTTVWADISTKQLETYMKVSGADVLLENMKKQIATSITMKAKMKGSKIPDDVLKEMTSILIKKENLETFTKGLKSLDEKDYKQIVKFYDTKIGKKNATLVRGMNLLENQEDMMKFSKKELPKERDSLISTLVKLSMSDKMMEKMTKVMMEVTLNEMPKEMQKMVQEKMDAQFSQMLPMMKKQAKTTTAYTYKDYSDEELKSLVNYYKTAPAQLEINAIIDGSVEYLRVVTPQVINMMKGQLKKSKKKLACLKLKAISSSLELFKLDNSTYPSTEEGLDALLKNPDSKKYSQYAKNAYLEKMMLDPWGSKIIYSNDKEKIELISYGADKKVGGDKENSDILLSECQ